MAGDQARAATSVHDPVTKATEGILDHHLQAFGAGDLSGILEDYTSESIIITPDGVLRGPEQMASLFEAFFAEFAKPGASFAMRQRVIEGETAYIVWSAETADNVYEMGTDTFWIHDGKIITQTFAAEVKSKH
jgi:ketosteroid isomerase-like protein